MKSNLKYIGIFGFMFLIHLVIFQVYIGCCEVIFIKYYLFLTLLFMMVVTLMTLFQKLFPDYLGFLFMGLMLVKLAVMFLIMNKLNLSEVPYYKINFILPYLVCLTLFTMYSIGLIQGTEKNQE